MGGNVSSLQKFKDEPIIQNIRSLFSSATRIEVTNRSSVWDVFERNSKVGFVLSTSPFADQLSGYQGPTMALAGFDVDGKCVGLVVDQTYKNEPYASYLNDDRSFQKIYIGKTIEQIAKLLPEEKEIVNLASLDSFDGFAFRVARWLGNDRSVCCRLDRITVSPMAYCRYGYPPEHCSDSYASAR